MTTIENHIYSSLIKNSKIEDFIPNDLKTPFSQCIKISRIFRKSMKNEKKD